MPGDFNRASGDHELPDSRWSLSLQVVSREPAGMITFRISKFRYRVILQACPSEVAATFRLRIIYAG